MLMQTSPFPLLPAKAFTFLRHGETDWNVEGRIQGRTDTPLNARGLQQAQDAAEAFSANSPITMIVTSPLSRALRTADTIATHLKVSMFIDHDLKERGFGSFEGRLRRDLEAEQNLKPGTSMSNMVYPQDAETIGALQQRAVTSIGRWLHEHPQEHVLFVSHGAFFRALHAALGIEHGTTVHNAKPYRFTPTSEGWNLSE